MTLPAAEAKAVAKAVVEAVVEDVVEAVAFMACPALACLVPRGKPRGLGHGVN